MDDKAEVCPFCRGSGRCHKCSGTGMRVVEKRGLRLARPVECRVCQGAGHCELCRGTGRKDLQV